MVSDAVRTSFHIVRLEYSTAETRRKSILLTGGGRLSRPNWCSEVRWNRSCVWMGRGVLFLPLCWPFWRRAVLWSHRTVSHADILVIQLMVLSAQLVGTVFARGQFQGIWGGGCVQRPPIPGIPVQIPTSTCPHVDLSLAETWRRAPWLLQMHKPEHSWLLSPSPCYGEGLCLI